MREISVGEESKLISQRLTELSERRAGAAGDLFEAAWPRLRAMAACFGLKNVALLGRAGQDSSDVRQEACLRLLPHLKDRTFPSSGAFWAYVHRVMLRYILEQVRKQEGPKANLVEPAFGDANDSLGGPIERAADYRNPSNPAKAVEAREFIETMLSLPEPQREALLHKYVHKLGDDEAADLMGVSPAAFKALLRDARAGLSSHNPD